MNADAVRQMREQYSICCRQRFDRAVRFQEIRRRAKAADATLKECAYSGGKVRQAPIGKADRLKPAGVPRECFLKITVIVVAEWLHEDRRVYPGAPHFFQQRFNRPVLAATDVRV